MKKLGEEKLNPIKLKEYKLAKKKFLKYHAMSLSANFLSLTASIAQIILYQVEIFFHGN